MPRRQRHSGHLRLYPAAAVAGHERNDRSGAIFGLGGTARFVPELEARVATGVVSPFVAQDFGEPHNDMLQMLASYGLLGGLALALLYFVPAGIFLRRMTATNPEPVRVAAAMGTALTLGFAIFGLTELMFRSMHNISLYVTLLAWLLVLSDKKRNSYTQ